MHPLFYQFPVLDDHTVEITSTEVAVQSDNTFEGDHVTNIDDFLGRDGKIVVVSFFCTILDMHPVAVHDHGREFDHLAAYLHRLSSKARLFSEDLGYSRTAFRFFNRDP